MPLLLTALLLLPALSAAQQLHTFKNGEVADADKLNESLQYVLNNASGGCSVEQVNNTAEITCVDGTTAVVPGYGTVLVFPEGVVGTSPPISYNTGAIVAKDANSVVLGEVARTNDGIAVINLTSDVYPQASLYNADESLSVRLGAGNPVSIFLPSSRL